MNWTCFFSPIKITGLLLQISTTDCLHYQSEYIAYITKLHVIFRVSGYRLCPPHATEVDAIQNKLQNLYQKVLIPDESSQVK